MKCLISNLCKDKSLCCSFCNEKRCADRCKDDHSKCKYFLSEPYVREPEKTEDKNVSRQYAQRTRRR